jgi:hypothetical protein
MLKLKFNALKSILTDFNFVKVPVLQCTLTVVKLNLQLYTKMTINCYLCYMDFMASPREVKSVVQRQ